MNNKNYSQFRSLIRRLIIEEMYAGSLPEESYSMKLIDDPSFNGNSVYVPSKVKAALKKWLKLMKLD